MGGTVLKKIVDSNLSELPLHYNSHCPKMYYLGGKIGRDNSELVRFDDADYLFYKEVIHIDSITFFYDTYIIGLTINYNVNAKRGVIKHC